MSSGSVEQIKARLPIADIIGGYIKLERAGSTLRARCPFHNEKTPSFHVSPDRGTFKCFGCGKGGDIFTFVQEIEGIEFRDALKILADKAGIELEHENREERTERSRILGALDESVHFYSIRLAHEPLVMQYLLDRGVTAETIEAFEIGFAPAEWQSVYTFLRQKGFTDVELDKTGLCFSVDKPGKPTRRVDRFRSRIMFPITNPSGHSVGFSGRIFGSAKNPDGTDVAKYINSPQTIVYDKSHILFGYSRAKQAIRTKNRCVIVEGQMDLIMSHQADIKETVAVSGTALTSDQMGLIKRLTDNIILAFDADDAGIKAARRSIEIALSLDMDVKLAVIEHGKDPADMILHNPADWNAALENAKDAITFFASHYAKIHTGNPRALHTALLRDVIPLIASLKHSITRNHFEREVAEITRIPTDALRDDVQQHMRTTPRKDTADPKQLVAAAPATQRAPLMYGILGWAGNQKDATFTVTDKLAHLRNEFPDMAATYDSLNDDQMLEYTVNAEKEYDNNFEVARTAFDDLIESSKLSELEKERKKIEEELRNAEQSDDPKKVDELLRLCQDINLAIQKTKKDRHEKNSY